jgi:hypothetical protein
MQTLAPDPELRPEQLSRALRVDKSVLMASFAAVSDRVLRVAVNSFMDNMNLVVECLDQLDDVDHERKL